MSTTTAVRPAGAHAATPRRPAKPSIARRLLSAVTSLLLAVGLLGFLFLAVGPHVLGYRTSTMLTGSMEPGIMPGDVVVTVPEPASELEVGDVISYQIPVEDHRVETHRVTEIRHVDGRIVIRTKGDANQDDDPWTATLQDDTVWEMKAVVPHLGTAVRVLRSPVVQHGVLWVGLGGLILLGLSTIWGKEGEE